MTGRRNIDGLYLEYGTDKTAVADVGVPCTYGAESEVICTLEASRMTLTGGLIGGRPNTTIPAGSYIKDVRLVVTEAFDSGTTATLDLGLCLETGAYTGLDEDGFDVAIAETAIDTAGKVVVCDGAYVGTTTGTVAGYPSYDLDTAVYTTGKGYLIITFVPPLYPDQTAN